MEFLVLGKEAFAQNDTSDPEILFQEKEYLPISCMKGQVSAGSKTVQGGRGEEFSGSAQVHVDRSVFTGMNLAGASKGNLPQVTRAAALSLMS